MNSSQNSFLVAIVFVAITTTITAGFSSNPVVVIGFGSLICVNLLGPYIHLKTSVIQEKKVEEVRTDLMINQAEDKQDKVETAKVLDGIAKVGVDTHTLVNAKFGALLRTNAAILRRMFESTGKEVDRLAAESAEKELSEHDARQAIVDANLLKG